MANYGYAGHGFSLKALLEDPSLQTAPNLNGGNSNLKKPGKAGGYMPDVTSAFLGPRWNKTPSGEDGSEFNLEYMDLDEFLSENGIPINLEDNDDAETISLLANALARTPPRSPNREPPGIPIGPPSPRGSISPSSPQLPVLAQSQKVKESSTLGLYLPESPVTKQNVSPLSLSPAVSPRKEQEPSAIERYLLDDNFGVKLSKQISIEEITSSPSKYVTKRKASFTEKIHEVQVSTIPVFMQRETPLPIRTPEYSPQPHSDVWEDSNIVNDQSESSDSNDSFVPQNSVPGTENFDPKNRKFTEEELKPQPIIKKSKKVFVEDSSKDDRYWQRRKKNNVAAKRSRDARRVKENQIAMRAAFLEQENDEMREELERVRKENEELIKRLSKYEEV